MSFGRLASFVRDSSDAFARIVLAILQLVAIGWFSPGRGLPLDDAWIHQVVARTFAETGTLGYAPGQHGAAATSYLWASLLAVNFKVLHLDPTRWALILNASSALASGQLLASLLDRAKPTDVEPLEWRAATFVATAFACSSPNVLWFVCSGMEAVPFIALSLLAIWGAQDPEASRRLGKAHVGGLAAGALALLRPEAAPLGALLAAHALFRRDLRRATCIAVPWALMLSLYVSSNLAKTGHALPSTLAGRRWLWFEMAGGLSTGDRAMDLVDQWVERLGTYTLDTSLGVVWVLAAIAVHGALRLSGRPGGAGPDRASGFRLLFVWAVCHSAFYALMLPTPGHGGRYQPLVPFLFAACLPLGTALLLRTIVLLFAKVRFGYWFTALGVAPWMAFALPALGSLREANALAVAHIQATELDAGAYLASLPEGSVASFDIGGTGYAANRAVLDLGGLSDPNAAALLASGRLWTWLEERGVRFVVLPASYEHVLPVFDDYIKRLHLHDNPALRLEPIRAFETPIEKWGPAIKATWNAAPKQIVYEVHYTGHEGPREGPPVPPVARRNIADAAHLVPRRERVAAEHMLAALALWGIPVDVQITMASPGPPRSSETTTMLAIDPVSGRLLGEMPGRCVVSFGWWGIAFDGCGWVAEPNVLRAMAYERVGRFLDVGDVGGALQAIPHVLADARRRIDPRYHPPIPPVRPPVPGGVELKAMRAEGWGLVLFAGVLFLAIGLGYAGDRHASVVVQLLTRRRAERAVTASLLVLTLGACGRPDSDVAGAIGHGRGAVEMAIANGGAVNLIAATTNGDPEVIAVLLDHGASLHVLTSDGASLLHVAARHGHCGALAILTAAMANEARGAQGKEEEAIRARLSATAGPRRRTALHDAASGGAAECVSVLLAAGAEPNVADSFGQTPLHVVAASPDAVRSASIAAMLLRAGADPHTMDMRGFTAFHAAAAADNAAFLRMLETHQGAGDAIDEPSVMGETALEVALRYDRDRAADVLVHAGARLRRDDVWPPLHDAARMDAVGRVANLIASGTDIAWTFRSKTALEVAEEHGSMRAARLLRSKSAALPRQKGESTR
jgi:ankyrin repeat protein